jgi:phosphoribosylamine--glycine ligase
VKVLVVGSGGREHALAWKLAQSEMVGELLACPGNPGIAALARCLNADLSDVDGTAELAAKERPDLVVVGPEGPLSGGLADRLREYGVPVFGPCASGARIESSKVFAKEFMLRHGVPTASFTVIDSAEEAISGAERWELPIVVKADGLAAGKGALVCHTRDEAREAVSSIMVLKRFGSAGDRIVVETCLTGEEASVLTLVGPKGHITLPASQDYKRIYEGDRGPNTGGMGALCPLDIAHPSVMEEIERSIVSPTLKGLRDEGIPFTGVLYSGLMLTDEGPFVIEFNCRMGDPESQAVLPAVKGDLASAMAKLAAGEEISPTELSWSGRYALCTVISSRGYPASAEKGAPIEGIDAAGRETGAIVFHAGTAVGEDGRLVTAGGRVLGVTGVGGTLAEARETSLRAVSMIGFDGAYFRRDIGLKWIQTVEKGEGARE